MSSQESSIKSIIYAFLANLGIAVIKTITAVITGSGSMLAESIHSFADCGNQGLLFRGLKSAKRLPNPDYPLGYGKEIYFWSFIVAIILFSMGGIFSIYEGIHKINVGGELDNPYVALIVLGLSILLEAASMYGCVKEINKIRKGKRFWPWLRDCRQSELVVVLGEDAAALLGLALAFVAILLTMITGNHVYDAVGSIGIGVLLTIISIVLGIKIKGLLIGKSIVPEERELILSTIQSQPGIEKVYNLITLQLGDNIMVAVKAKLRGSPTINQAVSQINLCEIEIKKAVPHVVWVFFEPDIKD